MSTPQKFAMGYFGFLTMVGLLNYLPIPGLVDANGLVCGIFALDIFDDLLHFASAGLALLTALWSERAARLYLTLFGAAYLADGLLGMATGVGYLDLGIFRWGVQPFDLMFRIFSNGPHIFAGALALWAGLRSGRGPSAPAAA